MNSTAQTEDLKAKLRAEALARRDALPAQQRQTAAEAIAARPFPIDVGSGTIISGYSPMKSELSPLPMMRKLSDAGAKLALPVVQGRGRPLLMRAWKFGEPLAEGAWNIRQPKADAPEVLPDILLVPLAAFDRHGHRIGYGAGYYDLTISALRAIKTITAIGLAFAAQEIENVYATPRDARLDLVLTEAEIIDFRKG